MSTQIERAPEGRERKPERKPGGVDAARQDDSTLVGGESGISPADQAAIEAEGSAARESLVAATPEKAASVYLYQPEHAPEEASEDDLPRLIADDRNFVWVDLSEYAPADLERVARLLDLPRASVEATLASWKRPRLQLYEEQFYVTATIPEPDAEAHLVTARQLDLFVGNNFLLSAHKRPLPMGERIQTRAASNPDLLEDDSACMLYIILDELLGCYEQAHEQIGHEIEQMEERALKDTSSGFLEDLLRFKRYVFALSQLTDQHRQVFAAFLRPDFPWVSDDEIKENYRDLQDHLTYLSDAIHADKDASNSAFDIYVSHSSHRTNNIMKVLTIVSTILLPASVLFGFFGTNNLQAVPLLMGMGGFVIMLAMVALISAGSLLLFHRKGWL